MKLSLFFVSYIIFNLFFVHAQSPRIEYYRYCENFQNPLLLKFRFRVKNSEDTLSGRTFRFKYESDKNAVEKLVSITHLYNGKECAILNNDKIVGLLYEDLNMPKVSSVFLEYDNLTYNLVAIEFRNNKNKPTPNVWGVCRYEYTLIDQKENIFQQSRFWKTFDGNTQKIEIEQKFDKLPYLYKLSHELIKKPNGSQGKIRVWREIRRMNLDYYRKYFYNTQLNEITEVEFSENGYFKQVSKIDGNWMIEKEKSLYNKTKDSVSFFKDGNYHKETCNFDFNKNQITYQYWSDKDGKVPSTYNQDGYNKKIINFEKGFIVKEIQYYSDNNPIENIDGIHAVEYKNSGNNNVIVIKNNNEIGTTKNQELINLDQNGLVILHDFDQENTKRKTVDIKKIILEVNSTNNSYVIKKYKTFNDEKNDKYHLQYIKLTPEGLLKNLSFKIHQNKNEEDTTDYHSLSPYFERFDFQDFNGFDSMNINYGKNGSVVNLILCYKEENNVKRIGYFFNYNEHGKSIQIDKKQLLNNDAPSGSYNTYHCNYELFKNKFVIKDLYYKNKNSNAILWKEEYQYLNDGIEITRINDENQIFIDKHLYYDNSTWIKQSKRFEKRNGESIKSEFEDYYYSPHRIEYSYDKNLNICATRYYDSKENLISQFDEDWVYYDSVVFNQKNLMEYKFFVDKQNKIISSLDKIGENCSFCHKKYEYNNRNQKNKETFWLNNNTISCNGITTKVTEKDALGRITCQYNLDGTIEITQNKPYSRVKYAYNEDNSTNNYNSISYWKIDKSGIEMPASNNEGYHKVDYEYDNTRGVTGWRFYNTDDLPMNEKGKNYHYKKTTYRDSCTIVEFFNTERKPATEYEKSTLSKYLIWPDHDLPFLNQREEYYGIDGQPIDYLNPENNLSYATGIYEFNENGDTIVNIRKKKNGQLLNGYFEVIQFINSPNDKINRREIREFLVSSKPKKYVDEKIKKVQIEQRDFYDNRIEIINKNKDQKIVEDENGVAIYRLDSSGNIISKINKKGIDITH